MSGSSPRAISRELLAWYAAHQRDLPWRRSRDPYAIWVSEIMLQQTQVATVIDYYHRWMKRFPTVAHLARADLDTVLKLWEGLGYYRRARYLHAGAQAVVNQFGGQIPADLASLRSLPGVGAYTAGAIASIAFDADEPVVDGNVIRVLCRVYALRGNPKDARIQKRLWTLARGLIPPGRAGDFNQALMDLGATICLPRGPRCSSCPLASACRAFALGRPEAFPFKAPVKKLPHYDIAAGIIWKGKKLLIDRRPHEGLLGGLWEFPGGKRQGRERLVDTVVREVREELGIEVELLARKPLITVKHAYSHFRITLHVFECRYLSGRPRPLACTACKWVTVAQLPTFAFPRANQKVIAALL